jgi:hypothetical protein
MSRDLDPPADPVLRVLHERIIELFPYGVGKIWMSLKGDNYYNMATVLGYSMPDFDSLMAVTPLISGRGVDYENFYKHLHVECVSRNFYNINKKK